MKVLMKKVGGYKKARMWNMAAFQTRRWHREQEALKYPAPGEPTIDSQPQTEDAPVAPPVGFAQPAQTSATNSSIASNSSAPSNAPGDAVPVAKNGSSLPAASSAGSLSDLTALAVKPSSRTRVGKIARLPHNARETVNAMLRGGFLYKDISAHLAGLGYPGITSNNVSFWKYHGYMDWLARQHELEARAHLVKSFEHCTLALDTDRVQQNAIGFAAEQLCQVMALYDHRNILNLLNVRPELFPKFVESLATLSRCSNDLSKAFASNQQSDIAIRAEMKANPIAGTLSEPISDKDVDADLADVEDEEDAPASPSAVSQKPGSLPPQPTAEPVPTPQGELANLSLETKNLPPRSGASSGSTSASDGPLGNSKQIQASTTNRVHSE